MTEYQKQCLKQLRGLLNDMKKGMKESYTASIVTMAHTLSGALETHENRLERSLVLINLIEYPPERK